MGGGRILHECHSKENGQVYQERHLCGVPHHIVSDNGVQFQGERADLIKKHSIEHHRSSPYRPQANGAVEAVESLSSVEAGESGESSLDY